jgi:hypothetical protein
VCVSVRVSLSLSVHVCVCAFAKTRRTRYVIGSEIADSGIRVAYRT